jgi:hypothetical protein
MSEASNASVEGKERPRVSAVMGAVAILGNIAAVAFLYPTPNAYRLAHLDAWAAGVLAHPWTTTGSALSFTLALFALAVWAVELGRGLSRYEARLGAWLVAAGALFNGLGTMTPVVAAFQVGDCGESCTAVARGLLGFTLTLDALFNLTLVLGLASVAVWGRELPSRLRLLAALAGVASAPVVGQAVVDGAADFLPFAALLWLSFILFTSLAMWRGDWGPANGPERP